jgi:hypothetical protein
MCVHVGALFPILVCCSHKNLAALHLSGKSGKARTFRFLDRAATPSQLEEKCFWRMSTKKDQQDKKCLQGRKVGGLPASTKAQAVPMKYIVLV